MQRSWPWLNHLMLHGYKCGVVENFKCLMNYAKLRLFWLPLSIMKCNEEPFTHIFEWKRHSPSFGSSGSSGWIWVVAMVALGFASMIWSPLSSFESELESRYNSEAFNSSTNGCFVRHSSLLCQGILWNSHHFPVSFLIFSLPFFVYNLDGLFKG